MKTFHFNPFGAAAIFTVLAMGVIGLIVALPIACIHWTWNHTVPRMSILPPINVWQAVLLYLAAATALFLSGIVQVEVDAESLE
ncbi:MAG: hypothetical protein K2X27_09400 [Candidatus Obscuribacterales bacterium]|nr:hypothetical protein [Candidatus Obscuribacterales bacterium]